MIKTIIVLTAVLILNGCAAFLPSISDKSNAMLQKSEWEQINPQNMQGSIK